MEDYMFSYAKAIKVIAISDRTIPIQLIVDNRSRKISQAATELNNTIPILITGMITPLLDGFCFNVSINVQMEK